jgi:DNA-binding MarR family transcriptional regulator
MTVTDAPPTAESSSPDDFLELAQVVMRALHSADLASWCSVDLTMSQLKALFLASKPAGATHGDIARALGVHLSTVTGVVDRLVEHGLVVRRTDPDDRRLSHVVATTAGRDLVDRLWASHRERLDRVLSNLTPTERTGVHAALQHMARLVAQRSPTAQE